MARSPQEYIDELYKQGQNTANNLHSQRTQADEEFIKQVNDAIDKATASSTKPYQSQIEQIPGQYQKLYDTNAVQELVNQRQIQETMANMGLTDSGLNRTQQTAIALQRGNADAAARLSQQQKTQELQDKISQIMETGAAQKQQQEAIIRNNTANWYNEMLNNLYNNAVQQGTSRYNTEQEAAAARVAAEAEAKAKAQQQAFDNTISVISAMEKAGAPKEAILDYMIKSGLIGSNAGTSGSSGNEGIANSNSSSNSSNTQSGLDSAPGDVINNSSSNTDTKLLSPKTETEVISFISKYTPFELNNSNPDPKKYGDSNNDYLKSMLAEEYNAGNLSDEAFALLCKHYGM